MKKSWPLGFLALGLVVLALSGCKKSSQSASQAGLLRYIPAQNHGTLVLPQIGAIPGQLEAILQGYEGKEGQVRTMLQGAAQRAGVDVLDTKSIQTHGFAPKGMLLATRIKVKGKKVGIVGVEVQDITRFEKWLQALLRNQLLARQFRSSKQPFGTVITVYRLSPQKAPIELAAYTFIRKTALIVWNFNPLPASSMDKPSMHNLEHIKQLAKLKASESLQKDTRFLAMQKKLSSSSQALVYIPKQKPSAQAKAKQKQNIGKGLALLKKRNPLLSRLPLGRLGALLTKNPVKTGTASLSFGAQGLGLGIYLPLPKVALAPIQSSIPQAGSAQTLIHALHKDSILSIRTGLNPKMVPLLLAQVAKNLKLKPNQIQAMLTKFTGLELQKDLLSAATGHVMLNLYKVNMNALQEVIGGNPFALTKTLELAVVAEVNDPKRLHTSLATMASKMQILGNKVTTHKEKDGRLRYSIPAWPGTIAHWTLYKNYFIYSVGTHSMERSIAAIDQPKQRMFGANAKPMGISKSSVVHLDLNNVRKILQQLPFMQRAAVSLFLTSYNVDRLRAITLSTQPNTHSMQLKASIQLQK